MFWDLRISYFFERKVIFLETGNQFLGTERIGKLMRQYAIPCIISLLVGALYNIVDQIFIANASYLGSYGNAANTVVFPLTVVALAVCTLVSLLLLNPPSPKTWAAMLSTLAGVALAGGVFYLFSTLLHLSGMNDTNGEGLVLVAGQTGLELHWLLLVAVLISSLGAVMDVALSLASSLHELREADGKMSGLQLFAAGMRIGRDMIGTMSNTLILAFAGEAVTTLLLLMAYGWHSSQLFASDYAAIQVAQGVASTLGVVLGVPITSGICAALYRPLKR